jgi:predicted nucleic acid-binding protein
MKYLIDTNIASELRKAHRAHPLVSSWSSHLAQTDMFLSIMTIMEIEAGHLRLASKDPVRAKLFREWLHLQIIPDYEGRILTADLEVALQLAALHVPTKRSERDAILAATALVHGLVVVTRNVKDFTGTGVKLLNPFEADPKVMTV